MHVDELFRGRASRTEHGVEQVGQPVRFRDDDARVFTQTRVEQLALQQLRRPAQAAQRILDLMRQLPHHQAAAAQLREQGVFAREPLVLGDVLDFQKQTSDL